MEAVNTQEQTQETFTGSSLAAQMSEATNTTEIGVNQGPTEAPVDDATLLISLEEKLNTGKFVVRGLSPNSVRYLNNFVKDKAKYSGVQDAYYLLILGMDTQTLVNIDNSLQMKATEMDTVKEYEMRGFTIKAANYFLSKAEGTGLKAAQNHLSIAQPINNAVIDIQAVEKQIAELKKKLGIDPPPAPAA